MSRDDDEHESIRDEQVKVFRMIRPLSAEDLVRGQFRGYRQEDGVARDSMVETFAAALLRIDSPRWDGVPFFIRAGKCLPTTMTEVLVMLKPPALSKLCPRPGELCAHPLSPDVTIAIRCPCKASRRAVDWRYRRNSKWSTTRTGKMDAYEVS